MNNSFLEILKLLSGNFNQQSTSFSGGQENKNPASSYYPSEILSQSASVNTSQSQNTNNNANNNFNPFQLGGENNLLPLLMSLLNKNNSLSGLSEIFSQKNENNNNKTDTPTTSPKDEILL